MNYYYHINERDSLIFKPTKNKPDLGFELFSKGEATSEMKIGTYFDNRWIFDDTIQRSKFLILMQQEPKGFQRAFKAYFRSLNEKPSTIKCGWVKFKLHKFRLTRKINNWIYRNFYGR